MRWEVSGNSTTKSHLHAATDHPVHLRDLLALRDELVEVGHLFDNYRLLISLRRVQLHLLSRDVAIGRNPTIHLDVLKHQTNALSIQERGRTHF